MSWRKPPKIAVRGMKKGGNCPGNAADAAAAAGEAAIAAGQAAAAAGEAASAVAAADGSSRLSRLSTPRGGTPTKARRNPKEVREAALAKKLAAIQQKNTPPPRAGTPRVRTTVTKTRSTPAGCEETTTVERVQSGPAVYLPRYNRQKVLHPEDAYREKKLPPPCKPGAPCPKVEKGKFYSREEVGLWEQWQKWNEFKEEVKCWQKNIPYVSAREKQERAFRRQFDKDEQMQEQLYKAGRLKVKPFHMRTEKEVAASAKKKKTYERSPPTRPLPKSPGGKKRYEKKDPRGHYIRYNCVGDQHPQDIYESAGYEAPEYVQPPLREDGTFKMPNERTCEETEAYMAYRKWEQFYFRLQAWENDKKWEGDPRDIELVKEFQKLPKKGHGPAPDTSTPQGRAEARAAERASRKNMAEQARREKMTRAEKNTEASRRKMGMGKLTGAAKVALKAAAKREAEARASEQAKQAAIAQRQRSFLRRGQRCPTVSPGGRIDVSRVQSRIGSMIREQRSASPAQGGAAQGGAAQECPPEPVEEYVIPPPPAMPFEDYESNLQERVRQRRSQALCNRMTSQIARHLDLTGQMGHLPTSVRYYSKGERPPPTRGFDVSILNYDQMRQPVSSLFGGPSGDVEEEMQGCDLPSPGWFEPDEPVERGRFRWAHSRMKHPSPPRSINKGRQDTQPWHPHETMAMQYDLNEDDFWFAEQELEWPDEREYQDRCMSVTMNKPLRERAAEMEARTDMNLLHPSVFRSNLNRRAEEMGVRGQMLSQLCREGDAMNQDLPELQTRRVRRAWDIPSPDITPEPECDELLSIDAPPMESVCEPRRLPTPPPAYTPPRAPSPGSPFEMPERFAPGGANPFLDRARAAINDPCVHVPFRGEEIAAQAARTAAAAQPRTRPDLFGCFDADDFEADMREQARLDQALEGMDASPPCQPGQPEQQWQFPEYRQSVGPQYGALYHQQIRQPQLGPWHCPRPC